MHIQYLENLSKCHPALARGLEIGILAAIIYILGIAITGDPFDKQALFSAFGVPILAWATKKKRDLEK